MALKNCQECGTKVSTKAKKCPICGAPVKRNLMGCSTLFVIIFVIISIWFMVGNREPSKSSKATKKQTSIQKQEARELRKARKAQETASKTPAEIREEQIKRCFSLWDGSHRGLTKIIKKAMNDPDSYDHEETRYMDKGDYLMVKTTFRMKNEYGGVVKNWVEAKVDLNGNVIEIISQGR